MKASEAAALVGGELIGTTDVEITGAAGLENAQSGDVAFLADVKQTPRLEGTRASCVIVPEAIADSDIPQIRHPEPQYAWAVMLGHLCVKPHEPIGVSSRAWVSDKAHIGENASIYPFAYIADDAQVGSGTIVYPGAYIGKGAQVGDGCILYPNVVVREGVKVGNRTIIHPGAVLGADGYGFVLHQGRHFKIPQVGSVVVGDDVEIGANTTIDRATTGETVVGSGTKIDNLVQIGHNVKIGENSILVAQVGIGGSSTLGNYVMLGGQVGIADHIKIDDGTMVAGRAGVMKDLKGGKHCGSPTMPFMEFFKSQAIFAKLPELQKRIRQLEAKIEDLERRGK